MHIQLLIEEPSVKAALDNLLPLILAESTTHDFDVYQGKQDLLQKLPARLRGYRHWLPPDWKIVVLLDEDRQDCLALKQEMEDMALQAGFATKTNPDAQDRFQVINRIAVEELEAWFFGDVPALHQAYTRIPQTLHRQSRYRNPDAIRGGTWEALARLLVRNNYFSTINEVPKIAVARQISSHMDPTRNRSHSFQLFYETLHTLTRPS
jgi:hypothetical protein